MLQTFIVFGVQRILRHFLVLSLVALIPVWAGRLILTSDQTAVTLGGLLLVYFNKSHITTFP